eukprot:5594369-Pleurochrysis_carterae.AAC.1
MADRITLTITSSETPTSGCPLAHTHTRATLFLRVCMRARACSGVRIDSFSCGAQHTAAIIRVQRHRLGEALMPAAASELTVPRACS